MLAVVGPGASAWLLSGDMVADANDWAKFLAAYDQKNGLEKSGDKVILEVGNDRWPFPAGLPRLVRWAERQGSLPEVLHMAGEMFEARAGAHVIASLPDAGLRRSASARTMQTVRDGARIGTIISALMHAYTGREITVKQQGAYGGGPTSTRSAGIFPSASVAPATRSRSPETGPTTSPGRPDR